MVEISPLDGLSSYYNSQLVNSLRTAGVPGTATPAAPANSPQAQNQEFLTIFYKEMLKSFFKTPSLNVNGDNEENNPFGVLDQDVMVEQFAKEMARRSTAVPGWLALPNRGLPPIGE